jgi:hypothetical protein
MRTKIPVVSALTVLLLATATSRGGDPKPRASFLHGAFDPTKTTRELRSSLAELRPPEIVEMLTAIANGSQMGPGEGWFHGGQSRYGWRWLAARHHVDKDGTITREEFQGPAELFERLDRNRDGVLTAADFDWSDRSPFLREQMMAGQWFRLFDADSNGRISQKEWADFFARAANGKDHVTADDLRAALFPPMPRKSSGPPNDGPAPLVLALGLLSGELGSMWEGPSVGQRAPDFTLASQDGKRKIRLADYRGKKPVVLIFGSFT